MFGAGGVRMQAKLAVGLAAATLLYGVTAFAIGASGASVSDPAITVVSTSATASQPASGQQAPGATTGTAATSALPSETGFAFGVQTHFSQGWSPAWLDLTTPLATKSVRDTVNWASVERTAGVYDFSGTPVQTLATFCGRGGALTLTITPKNALYDGGRMVSSAAGRTAYANYIAALLTRFGSCVVAIEVGNEVNSAGALDYPAGVDKFRAYVDMLRVLYARVKPANPQVAILGGSTNVIGTGFLTSLFAVGMLDVIDGVAVHPYRPDAEGIDFEIANLNAAMSRYGTPKPIWATEFSFGYADTRRASAGLVKSVVELYAAGVRHASWYALVEQTHFPYMGLFTGSLIKPQGRAYRNVVDALLPYGQPVRVDTGDQPFNLYRIGADRWVVWGLRGTISFTGGVVRDMYGVALPAGPVKIGSEPLIVSGATGYTITASQVVADTMLQYGSGSWSYWRRDKANVDTRLGVFDTDFASHFGDRWSKPLRINNTTAAPAGDGANPIRAVIRYTAPRAMQVELSACFSKANTGDGVDYRITRNGVTVASGIVVDTATVNGVKFGLEIGDKVDLVFGPNQTYGSDSFFYRATLSNRGQGTTVVCPTA